MKRRRVTPADVRRVERRIGRQQARERGMAGTPEEHARHVTSEFRQAEQHLEQARQERSCSMRTTHAIMAVESAAEAEHESRWVGAQARVAAIARRQKIRRVAVAIIGECGR